MKKKTRRIKNSLEKKKTRRISLSLLISYLFILLIPSAAILASYSAISNSLLNTQKERTQNLLLEAKLTFDREVLQAKNVGYYVSREKRLCDYLGQNTPSSKTEEFYSMYLISNNYPNYSMTNQIIQNVFVLIAESNYIMKIPQVIPNSEPGTSTLDGFPFHNYKAYEDYFQTQDKKQTLFLCNGDAGKKILFLPCQVSYPYTQPGKSTVVVQLSLKRIRDILQPVLAGQEGAVALLDEHGNVLTSYQNTDGKSRRLKEGDSWENVFAKDELDYRSFSDWDEKSDYNGWRLAAAIPKRVLTDRIGSVGIFCTIFCIISLVVGLMLWVYYYRQREKIVQEYFRLHKRLGTVTTGKSWKDVKFWGTFKGFLHSVESLQDTLEMQTALIKEDFLRKLLYGGYDSVEALKSNTGYTEFEQGESFYYVSDVELDDSEYFEETINAEELSQIVEKSFAAYLHWDFWIYRAGICSYIVLIRSNEEGQEDSLKAAHQKISQIIYQKIGLKCYIGISNGTASETEISHARELASRISEYAHYKSILSPLLPSDLPKNNIKEPQYFSIDMEVKLLSAIRGGTLEQLEGLLEEIRNEYFYPGTSQYIYDHALEILRSSVFRSISSEDQSPAAESLRRKAQNTRREDDIFDVIKEVKAYRQQNSAEKEESIPSLDKEKVAAFLEENYGDCNLNIFALAQWLNEQERKIYNDFKICFGMSFSTYLEQLRMRHACEFLKAGKPVKETAELVGYSSDYSFRRAFKRIVGITPSDYKDIQ